MQNQKRIPLQNSGRTLTALHLEGKEALLNYKGSCELWALNNKADQVIVIDGQGFEYIKTFEES